MTQNSPRLRVAISGGGIGGLALAAFICQHSTNIAIDIYETRPQISVNGSAIAIWKRTWQTLQDIGMEEEVRRRNLPLPKEGESRGPIFRKADQPREGVDFHNHMLPYGPLSMPRPILVELIQTKITDMCKIHTLKQVVSFEETPGGPVTIHFKDGSVATTDVLIGCDGVHSDTRATMYREFAKANPSQGYESFCEPKWSGQVAYRAVVSKAKIRDRYPDHQALSQVKIWCGRGKHAVTHPFDQHVHVICYYNEDDGYGKPFTGPRVTDVSTTEVIECFKGWEPDLVSILQAIENPSRWAIHVVDRLPHAVLGRVALVGDAAHAMTPHQGVGGGQAIEDAHILGRLLAHEKTTVGNLKEVLEIYQAIRLPLGQQAAEGSWNIGLLYDCIHPDHQVGTDATPEELKNLGLALQGELAWLGKGGCDEDWNEAEARLLQLDGNR